jgi:hypothetical protein
MTVSKKAGLSSIPDTVAAASGIRRQLPVPAVSGARNSGGFPFLPAPRRARLEKNDRLPACPQIRPWIT